MSKYVCFGEEAEVVFTVVGAVLVKHLPCPPQVDAQVVDIKDVGKDGSARESWQSWSSEWTSSGTELAGHEKSLVTEALALNEDTFYLYVMLESLAHDDHARIQVVVVGESA